MHELESDAVPITTWDEKKSNTMRPHLFYLTFCLIVLHSLSGVAQVLDSPITSSGLNTQVSNPITIGGKTQYNITGGTLTGANLFHSFGEFNVPTNTIANFHNGSPGVWPSNILGRITGGNPSNILGTIQTTEFGNANLFLMNPSGITFGTTASLNVGGSVAFTTADYLRFTDNGRFHAIPHATTDALLSTAPVVAYGFLGANLGAITVQGSQIAVSERRGISLIGGNISIQDGVLENGTIQPAHLLAPNGQINLATSYSSGEFLQDLTASPNLNRSSFTSFGSIHLASGSTVDISQTGSGKVSIRGGQLFLEIQRAALATADSTTPSALVSGQDIIVLTDESSINSQTSSRNPSPDIHIRSSQISVGALAKQLTNPETHPASIIESNTQGDGNAGNILLAATGNINITNTIESTSGFNSDGTDRSPLQATGNAGNITLMSDHGNIRMTGSDQDKIQVASHTFNSSGNTGEIIASASEGDIVLDKSVLFTNTLGTGGPGQTRITAKNLKLIDAVVSDENFGSTKSGGITIDLSDNLTLTDNSVLATASMSATGSPAANISIKAKDINVTRGSIINSATFSNGPGGSLKIITDTLRIADGGQLSSGSTRAPSRVFLPPNIQPSGAGGEIIVQALESTGSVLVDGQGSGIFADTEGTGVGGTINLFANTVTIQNGGAFSASTTGIGPGAAGGSINIIATDQVTLTSGASITARSTGPANAGNISINAGKQLDVERGSITTQSNQLNGGNISLQAIDLIRVVDSKISTSALNGGGNGGNISIDPKVVLLQSSEVLAQANRGTGGDISITTPVFIADQSSRVDASTPFGLNGRVTIQSPTSNLSGTVGQLVSKTSPPQVLLQNRCVALAGGEQSTFLLTGRETLPGEPSGWLSSPVSMEHWTGEEAAHASRLMVRNRELNSSPVMTAQTSQPPVLSLRRLTPPGFLVRTFATGVTGCPS